MKWSLGTQPLETGPRCPPVASHLMDKVEPLEGEGYARSKFEKVPGLDFGP